MTTLNDDTNLGDAEVLVDGLDSLLDKLFPRRSPVSSLFTEMTGSSSSSPLSSSCLGLNVDVSYGIHSL